MSHQSFEQVSLEDTPFQFDGYQVVRGEYFAHLAEPSVTFSHYKMYVNTACLRKSPDTTYIQVLVNPDEQKIAVRPCNEDEKDSLAWCSAKHKPREITCPMFYAKIMDFMNWSPDYRYKLMGKKMVCNGSTLFIFSLSTAVIFPYRSKVTTGISSFTPIFPASWKEQFGLHVEEHRKVFQINHFEKFAVFSVKESLTQTSQALSTEGGTNTI